MLVNIPYMEHMGFKPGINGIEWDSNDQFSGIFKDLAQGQIHSGNL
jgi:hypothetical protein